MSKKIVALLLSATMSLGLCTCSVNAEAQDTAVSYEGQTLKVAAFANTASITCWENICKAFEEAYGVTVELTADPKIADIVQPQILAGNYPDVYVHASASNAVFKSLASEKMLVELTDVYEGPGYEDETTPLKDQINEVFLTTTRSDLYQDGGIYTAPYGYKTKGLIYNKTLMEEHGWEVPDTWDEFMELGEKAKAEGIALLTYPGI